MNIKASSDEARENLLNLLRGVRLGERFTITLHGEAVANLVPTQGSKSLDARTVADDMLSFMQDRDTSSPVDLSAIIKEGRA